MITLTLLALAACSSGPSASTPLSPIGWEDAECAVCGMVVAEQPAPRGQLAYRDGTHAFACSLGDLRVATQTPGPRGEPAAVWVEALPESGDPLAPITQALPWIPAADAHFVVGFTRGGVMGHPVLAFAQRVRAEAVATQVGGHLASWTHLHETPFNEIPQGENP